MNQKDIRREIEYGIDEDKNKILKVKMSVLNSFLEGSPIENCNVCNYKKSDNCLALIGEGCKFGGIKVVEANGQYFVDLSDRFDGGNYGQIYFEGGNVTLS